MKLFKLESDAFLVCMTHALSTEQEEVMGLLIGEVWMVQLIRNFRMIYIKMVRDITNNN